MNNKNSVYDKQDKDSEYEFQKNEYIGLHCDCMHSSNPLFCSHPCLVSDSKVVEVMINVGVTNERVTDEEHFKFIDKLEDGYLRMITKECPQVKF